MRVERERPYFTGNFTVQPRSHDSDLSDSNCELIDYINVVQGL
jgi:hypothetical protein